MEREDRRATIHGVAESDMTEATEHTQNCPRSFCKNDSSTPYLEILGWSLGMCIYKHSCAFMRGFRLGEHSSA